MNGKPKLINNVNKYSEYRRIRFERTYRPLGRMTWWRVVLGVALLVFVLFLSGTVSGSFAARGRFKTAEALMVSPRWMETYRPELKAFLDSYEAFMDEYAAFMQKYQSTDASGSIAMMGEYYSILARYAEFAEKVEALDEGEMTDAELAYYLEVMSRVSQKLLTAAG